MSNDEYEGRIEALLQQDEAFRGWATEMRSFAKDIRGRTILLGLTAEETEEFLSLNPEVKRDWDLGPFGEVEVKRNRCFVLREKHDAARRRDAAQNLDYLTGGRPKQ